LLAEERLTASGRHIENWVESCFSPKKDGGAAQVCVVAAIMPNQIPLDGASGQGFFS
jgi:hypothetical protein